MAFTISTVAAKDGAGTTIGGGLRAADIAGSNAGPFFFFHGLVDGLAGANYAQVTSANALKVDPTVAFAYGSGAINATTQRMALATDSPGVITLGTAGSPSTQVMSMQGVVGGTPNPNMPTLTAAANAFTKSRVAAAASTNATSLKASAGNVASIDVYNPAAYAVFLKLYNKASAPTVGTDTPVWTIPVPAGGGYSRDFPSGYSFATGIAYAITKLQADSDTTVVVAGDLTGTIQWV